MPESLSAMSGDRSWNMAAVQRGRHEMAVTREEEQVRVCSSLDP